MKDTLRMLVEKEASYTRLSTDAMRTGEFKQHGKTHQSSNSGALKIMMGEKH